MKRIIITAIVACLSVMGMTAQGWPAGYGGVMLQGFYWDYYDDGEWGTWSALEGQAGDLEGYIDLVWVPNSARTKNDYCVEQSQTNRDWLKDMGYMPCFWLNHDNTIFGNTSDLKRMISTFRGKGIGIIEDVVINHKNGQNSWCDFPDESVTGTHGTYTLNWTLADICNNDNGGYVRTMFDVTGADDTGTDFDGCRDLDHTGANVQKNVKTYLDYLQKELGYAGFRYDMVKGYGPQYVGIYNAYAKPTFSVGECWDNWDGTTWWVNGTKQNGVIQSAAFDFPLKFLINEAFNGYYFDQSKLSTQGMAGNTYFQRYSVTFADNHDTYRDDTRMSNDSHVLAANAFILSMPGTPCIFLPHWKTHKAALKRMIAARKAAGVTNQSTFDTHECNGGAGRSFIVHGSNADILLLLGDCGSYNTYGYRSVWLGDNDNKDFGMYISYDKVTDETLNSRPSGCNADLGTARVDMPSGTYHQTVTVHVTPSDPFTTLVYTEDGSDPTTSSSEISAAGKTLTYSAVGTHTLKVGVKKGGSSVTDIQTYRYAITDQELTSITIYVRADKTPLYLYAWDSNGTLTSAWPGTQLSEMKSANGQNFYYLTFPKPATEYTLNYILSQGSDDTKTGNNEGIGSDIFVALGNQAVTDLTNTYTGATIGEPVENTGSVTVYVEANRFPLNLYVWDSNGTKLLGDFPGQQMGHTACINGKTWFYETFDRQLINLIVSDGTNQSADFKNVTGDVFLSYDGGDHTALTDKTPDYAGYPQAWYERGEICAFFTDGEGGSEWGNIHAWAWKEGGANYTGGTWPGQVCDYLGYNEEGKKLYKWTYTGDLTTVPGNIIFNNGLATGATQTGNCNFTNGAWYNTSNTGSNLNPVSTAVAPSTEVNIASLGTPQAETNWNGKKEMVAQATSGEITKDFILDPGSYIVQAIVRGTGGNTVTLTVNRQSASTELTGLDGASSTVQTKGIVESYDTETNNGWQKVELPITVPAGGAKVSVRLTSAADTWQLGDMRLLPGTTKTKATSSETETFVDATTGDFSFYERGANPNALIKATADTEPAMLPYNVIVDGTCANLNLTDGNYSFGSSESFTATRASYDRIFLPSQRSTIFLPFDLTAKEAAAAGRFWELDTYTAGNSTIRFVEVAEPRANTPYLFEATTAKPFLLLSDKTVSATAPTVTVTKDGMSFVGVFQRTYLVSDATKTYYGYRQSDATFVKVGTGGGANINAFRAYLMTTGSSSAPAISVSFDALGDNDATGIQDVKPVVAPMQQPIYDMSGRRVQNPTKGLYIIGGKKVYVK